MLLLEVIKNDFFFADTCFDDFSFLKHLKRHFMGLVVRIVKAREVRLYPGSPEKG